jgi:hypothetical protein
VCSARVALIVARRIAASNAQKASAQIRKRELIAQKCSRERNLEENRASKS